jgi:hypothetical protein
MLNLGVDTKNRSAGELTVGRLAGAAIVAAVSAGNTVFAFRHDPAATKNLVITLLDIGLYFNGTNTPAATTMGLFRFSGANTSGGTTLTPASTDSARPHGFTGDARISTAALTVTGTTFEANALYVTGVDQQDASSSRALSALESGQIVLHPGEGIGLQAITATLANMGLTVNLAFYLDTA